MNYINQKHAFPKGELLQRIEMNFNRLETEEYRVPFIFKESSYSWPGDWEGRTILALVLLAQSTTRKPLYLDEIISELPKHINSGGYFGELAEDGIADEQQIAGNSWFLRALCELYEFKQDEEIMKIIKSVVTNLLLPLKDHYENYPIQPSDRNINGQAIGELSGEIINGWKVSSDIGCAFIMLDGATHSLKLLKWPELAEIVTIMSRKFFDCDHAGSNFQTHATLSALRGVIRFMTDCGSKKELLPNILRVFELYRTTAMTINGENFTWFNRPAWTEGCAVADSIIIAADLWKITKNDDWLDLLHYITYNGFYYNQRPNGGFGCNTCAIPENAFIKPHKDIYEAYWCCSMRGGEGLTKLCTYMAAEENQTIYIPFPVDGNIDVKIDGKTISLEEHSAYPESGLTILTVCYSEYDKEIKLAVYIGKNIENIDVVIDGLHTEYDYEGSFVYIRIIPIINSVIKVIYEISLKTEEIGKGMTKFMHSNLILVHEANTGSLSTCDLEGIRNEKGSTYRTKTERLFPLKEMTFYTDQKVKDTILQLLFSDATT